MYRAPELLFRPDLVGDESEGIHEVSEKKLDYRKKTGDILKLNFAFLGNDIHPSNVGKSTEPLS